VTEDKIGELLTGEPARREEPAPPPERAEPPAADGTRILVIRHGQSEWNALGRGHGWGNPPLSALGEEQAREAVAAIKQQELEPGVVSSDLSRAARTAELVAEGAGLGEITHTADLREHDIGDWDGKTWEEIERDWPGAKAAWVAEEMDQPPNGETRQDFHARVERALRAVAEERPGARRLVVAHGGVVRALERMAGIEPTPIQFLSGRWFSYGDGQLKAGDPFDVTRREGADF
jgi:broad specificity phosphatase PhoE